MKPKSLQLNRGVAVAFALLLASAAADLRRSRKPGLKWESDFTTLTIAVLTR